MNDRHSRRQLQNAKEILERALRAENRKAAAGAGAESAAVTDGAMARTKGIPAARGGDVTGKNGGSRGTNRGSAMDHASMTDRASVTGDSTPGAGFPKVTTDGDGTILSLSEELLPDALPPVSGPAVALQTTSAATAADDMPTVPLQLSQKGLAKRAGARISVGTGGMARLTGNVVRKRFGKQTFAAPIKKIIRRAVVEMFSAWLKASTALCRLLGWYPSVKPYVGYGTEEYSRLVCRTVFEPRRNGAGEPVRGIKAMLEVPAADQRVWIDIDGVPLKTVQIGTMEVYDRNDPAKAKTSDFAVSDSSGYLDLLAEHRLTPGVHTFTCRVPKRKPVAAELFTIPRDAKVGVISDIDDTIMVTQVPTVWKAAYNMLLLSPRKRASVPGMAVMYSKIQQMFPHAPFFYLSTSPWNIESSVRGFIHDYGFPDGPMLLRDLDPRPKTFVPSGVNHKLEYAEQLMEDFPDMKFIFFGDDGQKDPTTYATIARRYPGRVLAIGIRQLSPREASGGLSVGGLAMTHPIPATDVPVFTGTTGANMMKTMLPYLESIRENLS